jgi:hypothetical protein
MVLSATSMIVAVIGCGSSSSGEPSTTTQNTTVAFPDGGIPNNPTGSVGGLVLDAATQAPLASANISLIAGGQTLTAMSGMDGVFHVDNVPAGTFTLTISGSGYESAMFDGALFGAVGNQAVAGSSLTVGPIGLVKNSGELHVRLVDESGAPAPMVGVTALTEVRFVDFSNGSPHAVGAYSVTAVSGSDGLVALKGLPDYASLGAAVPSTIGVDVAPATVKGSESYSFLGLHATYDATMLDPSASAPTIVLAGPHTPLQVVASNAALVANALDPENSLPEVAPNGPIYVTFNQAIDPSTVRVALYDEDGVTLAPTQAMAAVTTNVLAITPAQALVAGVRYNVLIHVDSLTANGTQAPSEYNNLAPVFVEQASGVTPTVNANSVSKTVNGSITTITFTMNEPIGLGRGNPNAIDCVAFYEGVNLDNGDPAFYPGEWSATSGAMKCDFQGNPAPAMNITILTPIEQAPTVTGFASKFSIAINNMPAVGTNPAPCEPGIPVGACPGPQTGNKIHLVFSKLYPGATIRRVNGQPVVDDPTKLVITIP